MTPGQVTIRLPPKWRLARDQEGHIYFYHTKTRFSQWDIPSRDLHKTLMTQFGLDSDSDSDSDLTSSSDVSFLFFNQFVTACSLPFHIYFRARMNFPMTMMKMGMTSMNHQLSSPAMEEKKK